MKKIALSLLLFATLLSCKKNETPVDSTENSIEEPKVTPTTNAADGTFDTSKITLSDKELGKFPYLNPPKDYNFNHGELTEKQISDLDKEYFAVNGKLFLQEGKTAKFELHKNSESNSKFNALTVEKSFDDQIKALGGVAVNDVVVPTSEIKRVGDAELITKHYGNSLDYNMLDQVKTYLIRKKDKEIWIQFFAMNEESGRMTVLEKMVAGEEKSN